MSIRSSGEYGGVPGTRPAQELDVGRLGRSLGRRKGWIIGPALLCCGLAAIFVSFVQPRYTADAKVIIENGESYFTRPDKTDLQQQQLPDDEAVQSQVQLISSRDLAREAIRRLNLKGNPEFDPLAKGLDPISQGLVLFGLERDPTSVAPEDRILSAYYDRLMVFPLVKTRVITIEFTATDPDLAARAANTIAELYIEAQSTAKRQSARAAADSLGALVSDLRARSAAADAQADAYRSQNGLLVGLNNNTITSQQLADISTQLAQSRTAEADSQAKAKLIRDMIRQGRIAEVPDVANNELIRRISEQRVTLRAELAQQGRTLLPGHPRMQELNAQLQDVDNQLRLAAEKAIRTLENDAFIATSRVENLTKALDLQKKTASTAGADQVQLNTLELQARLLKEQLEFNTSKYQEALARVAAASTPADARVISRAEAPQLPSFPKKLPIILIATLAGLVLSLGILVSRELLSGRAFAADPEADDDEEELPLPHEIGLRPALREPPAAAVAVVPVVAVPAAAVVPAAAADPVPVAGIHPVPDLRPEPAPVAVVDPVPDDLPLAVAEPIRPLADAPILEAAPMPQADKRSELPRDTADAEADQLVLALEDLQAHADATGAVRLLLTSAARRRYVGPASLHLARRLARRSRTILVDVERDMPAVLTPGVAAVSEPLGDAGPAGLAELINGEATFAEIIHRDSQSRLHVVPVGGRDLGHGGDDAYRLVIEALAETYDFVLLHAPGFCDPLTQTLVASVDAVVLVYEDADVTDLKTIEAGLQTYASKPVFTARASTLITGALERSAA